MVRNKGYVTLVPIFIFASQFYPKFHWVSAVWAVIIDFSRENTYTYCIIPSIVDQNRWLYDTWQIKIKSNGNGQSEKEAAVSSPDLSRARWHQTNENLSKIKWPVPRWVAAGVSGDSERFIFIIPVRSHGNHQNAAVRLRIYGHGILIWLLFAFMFMVGISSSAEMGSR